MKREDKEAVYVAALLACGPPPPKPTVGASSQDVIGTSHKRRLWEGQAEHYVYRGLRKDIERRASSVFERQTITQCEIAYFYNWLERQQRRRR